jgi:hypothetical protein
MTSPQELRIGNYITDGNDVKKVTTGMLSNWDVLNRSPYDGYKAIPLNEYWIGRLGWDNFEDGWWKMGDFTWNIYDEIIRFKGDGYQFVNHVHTLQNLYYALKNEELILNTQ